MSRIYLNLSTEALLRIRDMINDILSARENESCARCEDSEALSHDTCTILHGMPIS